MNKMTYAVAIDKAINGELSAEVVERLNDLKASLAKRSSKPSEKKVAEQDGAKRAIASAMAVIGKPCQVNDIAITAGLSPQRVTAMLTKMVADGVAIRTLDKKKAFYALIPTEGESEVTEEE